MFGKSLDDAVDEFRCRAPRHIAVSDHKALKAMFSDLMAAARLGSKEDDAEYDEAEVKATLETELRRSFYTFSEKVKRGLFDDL